MTGGGLDATQVNVFIDGVSYKNDVLDGGVVGQDSSRGSPFPQSAVQEFRVLYAELQSGAREGVEPRDHRRHQEGRQSVVRRRVPFLSEQEPRGERVLRREAGRSETGHTNDVSRALHWRPNREGPGAGVRVVEDNRQERAIRVFLGGTPIPPSLDCLHEMEGTFVSAFREHLFFGKLTLQPQARPRGRRQLQTRNETDIRGFGEADQLRFRQERTEPGRLGPRHGGTFRGGAP